MRIERAAFVVAVAIAGATVCIWAAVALNDMRGQNASAADATTEPSTEPAASMPASKGAFAAMDYYATACAHCHGPQGSFYGATLGNHLTDQGLLKVVVDMAAGPGASPLAAGDAEVEMAFHRALVLKVPYVAVTGIDAVKWTGEVMPDATVTITVAGKDVKATVDDSTWTATMPERVKLSDVVIVAELGGKKTTLKPNERMYSNGTPLPPPEKR